MIMPGMLSSMNSMTWNAVMARKKRVWLRMGDLSWMAMGSPTISLGQDWHTGVGSKSTGMCFVLQNWQLVVLFAGVVVFSMMGLNAHRVLREGRKELMFAELAFLALSSVVAGYASGSYFKIYFATTREDRSTSDTGRGKEWRMVLVLTVLLLPIILAVILLILSTIAFVHGTIFYIPYLSMLKVFFLWISISAPLCMLGTVLGRHANLGGGKSEPFPCPVNITPRAIPKDTRWYGVPVNVIPCAGLATFGFIFIKLDYMLASLCHYRVDQMLDFVLGFFTTLVLLVCMTTIIAIYFCLNSENYLWQWTAFFSGASTALYVFLYSVYYFAFKTEMHGLVQTTFYFGYMLLISLGLGTLCGTLGHWAASKFVLKIFQNIKID